MLATHRMVFAITVILQNNICCLELRQYHLSSDLNRMVLTTVLHIPPLANSQLSRHHETECIHAYSNAEPWQAALAVENLTEALQHLYIADFPVWIRVLGDYQGRRMQDQCPPSMVFPYASRHQVVSPSPTMKFDTRTTNLYSRKLYISPKWTTM